MYNKISKNGRLLFLNQPAATLHDGSGSFEFGRDFIENSIYKGAASGSRVKLSQLNKLIKGYAHGDRGKLYQLGDGGLHNDNVHKCNPL